MPIDLWSWVTAKLSGVGGPSIRPARKIWPMIASAMIQCRTIATPE